MRAIAAGIMALIMLAACQSLAQPADGENAPQMIDAPLPIPPAQHDVWERRGLHFDDLTAKLFEIGFADPRRLPYHALELSERRGESGDARRARGWVIPQNIGGPQQFAILWDGTIIPVIAVRAAADVVADARLMLEAERASTHAMWWGAEEPESPAVPLIPATVAMLNRLGHWELADEVWRKSWEHLPKWADQYEDYVAWALIDWTKAMMRQADFAHGSARDRLCLSTLERMAPAYQKLAAEQARRIEFQNPLDLWHLELYPALLKDQRRRNASNRRDAPPAQFAADSSQRIAQLIRELDQVGFQMSGTWVRDALRQEGEAAVGPLIEVVRSDMRLSRGVILESGKLRNHVMTVADTAIGVINNIIGVEPWQSHGIDPALDPERRREAVAALDRFWQRYQHVPPPMRWYLMLADDEGDRWYWVQAAEKLASPQADDSRHFPDDYWLTPPSQSVRGETLRALEPSVSALLAKRIRGLTPGVHTFETEDAMQLALRFFRWDPQGARPVMAELTSDLAARKYVSDQTGTWTANHYPHRRLALLFLARMKAGDDAAFEDYAQWLSKLSLSHDVEEVMPPIQQFPQHPRVEAAVDELFSRDNQPWSVELLVRQGREVSPLLVAVAPARQVLIEGLEDQTIVGEGEAGEMYFNYRISDGSRGSFGMSPHDRPPVGTKHPLRRSDVLAWQIGWRVDLPDFQPYWPLDRRDRVIAEIVRVLKDWPPEGGAVEYVRRAWPQPEPLDRPATEADVEAGRAVFALPGERRVFEVPAGAGDAYWTPPGAERVWVRVLQAEEQKQADGTWRRFYGVEPPAGGERRRVPAEELEWSGRSQSLRIADGVIATIRPEFLGRSSDKVIIAPSEPLTVQTGVQTIAGVDRPAPTQLVAEDEGRTRLLRGLAFHVQYADQWSQSPDLSWHEHRLPMISSADAVERLATWVDIPRRKNVEPLDSDGELLQSGAWRSAEAIDLREWFVITRPGLYRFWATLESENGQVLRTNDVVFAERADAPAPPPLPAPTADSP